MKLITLLFLLFSNSLFAQKIENPWMKMPMPGLKMTAAYMNIVNDTKKDLVLEKVSGPDAEFYEIHTHNKVDGVMQMRKIDSITVKAGQTHTLKPMSDHIMLIKMHKRPFTKKTTELTLFFKDLGPLKIEVPVLKKN